MQSSSGTSKEDIKTYSLILKVGPKYLSIWTKVNLISNSYFNHTKEGMKQMLVKKLLPGKLF